MSTSTHPIIILFDPNVEDVFSSTNNPDYTPASPDYFPASPGNTSSDPSEDLSKYLLVSLAILPFHDDPFMKVKQAYNATSNESLIPPQALIAPPTVFPSSPTSLERHEEQIETILNNLDKLPLEHGRVLIQRDFDSLEIELQKARTQIVGLQREQMGHTDEIVLAHVRISTLEMIIEDIQIRHCNCTEDCKVKFSPGTLPEEALSWWNSFAQPIRIKEAYKITWNYKNKGLAIRSNLQPVSVTCHACGEKGQFKIQCSKADDSAHERAYLLRDKNAHQNPNVVTGTNTVIQGCTLILLNQPFKIDPMPMKLSSFDFVIGMDWLSKYHSRIICDKKVIHIPIDGETLIIRAQIMEKKSDEKRLEDIPVVREFPEVFHKDLPGLSLIRQVGFQINLIPGVEPVARAPYRLAHSEMQKLSNQLKELADRGFIRPSHHQLRVWDEDIPKTAFRMRYGHYEFQQRSYANVRRKPFELQVEDRVMLKVSPQKGVIRFGKQGKVNPWYIGPFKILKRVVLVAYTLELPEELSNVHNTFYVSSLKKCLSYESFIIPMKELHLNDKLNFMEEPVEIIDQEVKQLRQSHKAILSGADNRPPMLEKDIYDSWKSRMELYMLNRQHGRMILQSVEHGPLLWPTVEENGVTRQKKYSELSAAKAIQADCDVKATNIILQVLPLEVYALVSTHKSYHQPQFQQQASTYQTSPYHTPQFVSQGPSSSNLSISYPVNDTSSTVNYNAYMASSSAPQIDYALMVHHSSEYSPPETGLVVLVFQKGDDPIDAINHMMSFLTAVVTSRYPATNNPLKTSSNPRQQATINNGRVTIQPIQGRQNSMTAGLSRPFASGSSGASGRQRVIVCYKCKGEGHMFKQCTKPKRKRDAKWFKDKVLLVQA
nr:reverse transcriptase domain-containing protein [Tanacetum cinerariifolium]